MKNTNERVANTQVLIDKYNSAVASKKVDAGADGLLLDSMMRHMERDVRVMN